MSKLVALLFLATIFACASAQYYYTSAGLTSGAALTTAGSAVYPSYSYPSVYTTQYQYAAVPQYHYGSYAYAPVYGNYLLKK